MTKRRRRTIYDENIQMARILIYCMASTLAVERAVHAASVAVVSILSDLGDVVAMFGE